MLNLYVNFNEVLDVMDIVRFPKEKHVINSRDKCPLNGVIISYAHRRVVSDHFRVYFAKIQTLPCS